MSPGLSIIEIDDIEASEEERRKGLTKQFDDIKDLFKWLDEMD